MSYTKPLHSTNTAYFWVKDASENITENRYSTAVYNGHNCTLEGLNILFRHGSRYPTIKLIQEMTKLIAKLKKNRAVVFRLPFLKQYLNPFAEKKEALLSPLGKTEMLQLGQRFAKRFHTILAGNLDNINFTVTSLARTRSSYRYFYSGLKKTLKSNTAKPDAHVDNKRLRFFDTCKKYKQIQHNKKVRKETKMFSEGNEITNVVKKVRNRLGFSKVTLDEVKLMQQYCAFEIGVHYHSHWCQLFDVDDLKTIDYMYDIQSYHEWGYAYHINWQQSCPFTSHMFDTFDKVVQTAAPSNRVPKVDIAFGHAETILPVLTAFGLFKDSRTLLANNFAQNTYRKFHGAEISPFAANIAVGLYRCSAENYVTKFFVNEVAVHIPACGHTICSFLDVMNYYSRLAYCNFDHICNHTNNHQPLTG